MADNSEAVETPEERVEPDFDTLTGIITDGIIGAVGGAVGTAAMTVGLLIASSLGAFDFVAFAELSDLTGLGFLFPANHTAVGYLLFLAGGMVTFPLLFASIGSYLPGEKFAFKGLPFGFVLWTGFVGAFYVDQTGVTLALYAVITLIAHLFYGFTLGAVFDYFSNRPDTLV